MIFEEELAELVVAANQEAEKRGSSIRFTDTDFTYEDVVDHMARRKALVEAVASVPLAPFACYSPDGGEQPQELWDEYDRLAQKAQLAESQLSTFFLRLRLRKDPRFSS